MGAHLYPLMRVPADALFDLEKRLYEPRFMGVPIGAALTDFLALGFAVGPAAALRALLVWQYYACRGPRHHSPLPPLEPGRILLTWLADVTRLNDMLVPVLAELDPGQCNVIGGAAGLREKVPAGMGFYTRLQVLEVARDSWRREYVRCRVAWHRQVWRWLRENRLPLRLFPYFAHTLEVRALHIRGFFDFLDRVQPRIVVTEAEHNHPWSCLILAARQRGIPTVAMMHGVIYPPYGYTPLLSDVALCWGEQQKEQMIELGTEPERLLIAGCQRINRTIRANRQDVRARLGLPPDKPVVMLATSPIVRSEWRKLMFTFGDAFQGQSVPVGVVRLHPSEKLASFRAEIQRYPDIRFLENRRWSVEEAMAACDVVVIHNSGLGNDALVMERPVVLLGVLALPLSNGLALAEKAGCPVVRTASDLRLVVNRILGDSAYRGELKVRAEEYVKWFCAAFGREAARNVADEVRRRAR